MDTSIVFVTYNRLEYTKKSIVSLLNKDDDFLLYLWDNASTDGTQEYLKDISKDSRVKEVVFHKENVGPTYALNYFWHKCDTELVGKVDNDCLVEPGWIKIISKAHEDIPQLGAIACWHYRKDDFDESVASKKIQKFGKHFIFRHPWVCGTGFLLKKSIFLEAGDLEAGSPRIGMTDYFLKIAQRGYINGWYYPLILQEHMDDPFSPYSLTKNDDYFQKFHNITYSTRENKIKDIEDSKRISKEFLNTLLYGPFEAKHYTGWRAKLKRIISLKKRFFAKLDLLDKIKK
ncbi:MAG: glycosyltransferase [Proteobacteria bacterium]|nr:glycosyltransferase [Pseudomonadota bacterium]